MTIKLHTSSNNSHFHFVQYIKPSSTVSRLAKSKYISQCLNLKSSISPFLAPSLIQKKYKIKEQTACLQESGLWVKSPKTSKAYETALGSELLLPRHEYLSETSLALLAEVRQCVPALLSSGPAGRNVPVLERSEGRNICTICFCPSHIHLLAADRYRWQGPELQRRRKLSWQSSVSIRHVYGHTTAFPH